MYEHISVSSFNFNYVNRSSTEYGTTLATMTGALADSSLGGYFYVTHGDDGTDPIPTLHYVADFPKKSSQTIEFGSNLRDYVKTLKAEDVATAIIPLGTTNSTEGYRLTIEDVNNGRDYIYDEAAVALYGWVFKTVIWEDVTLANNLLTKAQEYLEAVVNQSLTIELNAIDLHLLNRSIESFEVCSYVPVVSPPHNLDTVLLCNRQTMSLLKPETDSIELGVHIVPFTSGSTQMAASISTLGKTVSSIKQDGESIRLSVEELGESMAELEVLPNGLSLSVKNNSTSASIQLMAGDEALGSPATINMTGLVTFNSLADGTTTIDGGCIKTGKISADRIDASSLYIDAGHISGTLTIGQLPSSVAETSDIPQYTSQLTNNSGFVNEGSVTTIIGNTVTASYINAFSITARHLKGQTVGLYSSGSASVGGLSIVDTSSGDGLSFYTNSNKGGIRIEANGGNVFLRSGYGPQFLAGYDSSSAKYVLSMYGGALLIPTECFGSSLPSSGTDRQIFFKIA